MNKVDAQTVSKAFPKLFIRENGLTIKQLAGDVSSRQYFRLSLEGNKSTVLQVSEPFARGQAASHPFLSAQALLKNVGVRVPEILATQPDLGWILLQDVGDTMLQEEATVENYRQALDASLCWTVLAAQAEATHAGPHFSWHFDFAKLNAEMAYTQEHLFQKILGDSKGNFLGLTEANSKYLAQLPRFLNHRDYHSRNIMIHGQQLYVIDFQDARMGPITYDLVSLLWDPYAGLSEELRQELQAYWLLQLKKMAAHKQVQAVLDAVKDLSALAVQIERMKVQRLLKAVGSYAGFYNLKQRRDYLPHIVPTLRHVRRALEKLCQGPSFPQDRELIQLLDAIEAPLLAILKG